MDVCKIPLRNKKGDIVAYSEINFGDYERVKLYKWYKKGQYAVSSNVNGQRILLHHFILGKPQNGKVIDHINGNKLDNRKSNLRIVTPGVNNQNRIKKENTSSKYRGVSLCKKTKKWSASYSHIYLGKFEDEMEAAKLYDKYVYCALGNEAITNVLSHDELSKLNLTLNSFKIVKTRLIDLPTNISLQNSKYYAIKKYKNIVYKSPKCKTVEEAESELVKINQQISLVKKQDDVDKKNRLIIRNSDKVAIIPIYNRQREKILDVLVDDNDWHMLMQYKWNINSVTKYVETCINSKKMMMHELLMDIKYDKGTYVIDHINKVRHDNRRKNLRLNTRGGNSHNKSKASGSSSQYYGVFWYEKISRWVSQIYQSNKRYHLGWFINEHEAAKAYNKKAQELYGEYANLNIVPEFKIKPEEVVKRPQNKYKGVYWNKNKKRFEAAIIKDKIRYHLGTYIDEIDAVRAYNKKASELFGESAELNEIPSDHIPIEIPNKIRGAYYSKVNRNYNSCITVNKIKYNLGYFETQIEAALAYNKKAKELLGDKAKLNIID